MTEKTFLVTIDFEKECCPYAQDAGCEHPATFIYLPCDGNSQIDDCPLVPVRNVDITVIKEMNIEYNTKKYVWVEE